MTYASVVFDLVKAFPEAEETVWEYMDRDEPLAYVAFGCVLIPYLRRVLDIGQVAEATRVCGFLEEVSASGDAMLEDLVGIELGELLPHNGFRESVLPFLGPATKRACTHYL